MINRNLVRVILALLGSATAGLTAEFFTSPTGRTSATGSVVDPLDFTTAISSGASPVRPGDTLWVRGGVYTAPIPGFIFSLNGAVNQPVIFRNYNNERAIIDGTFKAHGKDVYYWGLEFTDKTTPYLSMSLTRSQKEAKMLSGSYSFCSFNLEAAPSSKFINNIFHDSYGQIEYGVSSSNSIFYGNIVMNMGEQCLDNERGVGVYTQNREGTRELTDNIVAQNILNGIDVWSSGNSYINNYTLEGNICFNNGYGKIQGGRNMLTGAGNGCTNLLLVSNILYYATDTRNRANLIVGHGGQSYAPRIYNTLAINGGFELTESFGRMEFTGNELLSSATWNNNYIAWPQDRKPTAYVFSNNKYYGRPLIEVSAWLTNATYPNGSYLRTQPPSGWLGWQEMGANYPSVGSSFRPDADSFYTASKPSGTRVIVRPNRYETGRAHIAILNFDLKNTVEVDLSSLGLPLNTAYELHSVQNLYNQTNTGIYTGGPITVPMTGWGFRQPPSRAKDLTSAFPQFGAFLFIARGTTGNTLPAISSIPDQSYRQGATPAAINFTVSDLETAADSLILGVTSDNSALVPIQNILLAGSGSARTLTITPQSIQLGTAMITVTADDGLAKTTRNFNFTVTATNRPPFFLSAVPAQTLQVSGSSSTLLISLGDPDTDGTALTVTAISSNPSLLPISGLALGGSGFSRTLKITPAIGVLGSAVVTVQVSDGLSNVAQSFPVEVTVAANTRPTLTSLADATLQLGSLVVGPLSLTVGDAETPAGSLVMGAHSRTQSVVKDSNIVFGGSGSKRTVTITAEPGLVGSSVILLWVSDGQIASTNSIKLTIVSPPPPAPTLFGLQPGALVAKPATDTRPPLINALQVEEVTPDSITVTWDTDELADSQVEFGANGNFQWMSSPGARFDRSHSVTLSHLAPDTLYVLRARTRDQNANLATSSILSIRTLRPTFAYLPLTAEAAQLEPPMTWVTNSESGDDGYLKGVDGDPGTASWKFSTPVGGTYYVWGRVGLPHTGPSPFVLRVDGGTTEINSFGEGAGNLSWQWRRIEGGTGGDSLVLTPRTFKLSSGIHSLVVAAREPQTRLNRLLVTNDPDYVPSDEVTLAGVNSPTVITDPIYRVSIPAGWSMIGNPLRPSDPRFSAILPSWFNEAEYDRYNSSTADFSTTELSNGSWSDPDLTFGLGEGGFFHNSSSASTTLVLTGEIVPSISPITLYAGLNLISPTTPMAGNLSSLLNDFQFITNDKVMVLDSKTRDYHIHTYSGDQWDEIPVLNLGEAVFLYLGPR